jgi:uncharacterized membrane protein YccC
LNFGGRLADEFLLMLAEEFYMTLGEVQREGYRAAQRLRRRLSGLRYAVRVLISGAIVWLLLAVLAHADPLWGLISSVVVTDLKVQSAMTNFVSRMLNTLIGCGTGLVLLKLFGASAWVVLLAMALAIVISSDLVKVPLSWRIAPITTAIVMTPAYLSHSPQAGLRAALERTGDVVLGSAVAVAVSAAAAGLARWRGAGKERAGSKLRS